VTGDGWLVFPANPLFIFTFNMLFLNGKSFIRSQKDLKLFTLLASIVLELCKEKMKFTKNEDVEWLDMVAWCFQPNYSYISYYYVIPYWKIIFQKQESLKLIYLWATIALELWLVIIYNHQKSMNWVTGDGYFIHFQYVIA